MKNILKITGIAVIIMLLSFVTSDNCSIYYPAEKGVITETTYYNAKGKPEGTKMFTEVTDVSDSSGYLVEEIHSWIMVDDHDTAIMDNYYRVMCKGDKFIMDMTNYVNSKQLEAYKGMDVRVNSTDISIPANPKAGDKLDDGKVEIQVKNEGINVFKMTVDIKNRKVDALEKITTPAGTFDAVKITYDLETKIGFVFRSKGIQWFVKDVGIVRTENLNKKGKLQSYSEITAINKK